MHPESVMARQLRMLGFETYDQYLASPLWAAKKQEYAESDLPKHCRHCKDSRFLLHHLTYHSLGSENIFTDFIALCQKHHHKLHLVMKERGLWISEGLAVLKLLHDTEPATRPQKVHRRRKKRRKGPRMPKIAAKGTKAQRKREKQLERLAKQNDPAVIEAYLERRRAPLPDSTHRMADSTFRKSG